MTGGRGARFWHVVLAVEVVVIVLLLVLRSGPESAVVIRERVQVDPIAAAGVARLAGERVWQA
ncbi:hypothetical protein [Rhodococcus triatomae]